MKILVLGDIHGNIEKISEVVEKVKFKPDIIICPGDFTDMFEKIEGFSQLDIGDMVIQKLLSFNCPVLSVPGNHDPHNILKLFDKYDINIHGKKRNVLGVDFIGWGGALTPFNTFFEPSDEETRSNLERLSKNINDFVLVVHNPPKNTKLDKVSSGDHVGSSVIREFIEKYKPILSISAHIHEVSGIDKIGDTTLFYPGPVYESFYGVVDIDGKNVKCKIERV